MARWVHQSRRMKNQTRSAIGLLVISLAIAPGCAGEVAGAQDDGDSSQLGSCGRRHCGSVDLTKPQPTSGAYASAVLADSPVGYWRLGEPGGTVAADSSPNGNTATYGSAAVTYGRPGALTGDSNTAVTLAGSALQMPTAASPWTGDFTVESWVMPHEQTQYFYANLIAESYRTSGFRSGWYGSSLKPMLWTSQSGGTASVVATTPLTLNAWNHLAFTKSGTTVTIYVNGVQAGSGQIDYIGPSAMVSNCWGQCQGMDSNADFDELAVYKAALSPGRVKAHYDAGSGLTTPPNPTCGDQVCDGSETCSSCPGDCGSCPGSPDMGTPPVVAPTAAPTPTAVLSMPTGITNGTTVSLQCGHTYQGTLELSGRSNVTVTTAGTCGKANLTPGRAVTGFTQYQGSIYSAAIAFTPVQVAVAGVPVAAAHWPNKPQVWATNPGAVPNSDLAGATLVWLENQSVIKSQTLGGNSVGTSKPFYVEGKLWMLDSPGEWAVSGGRLYVWAPDGQSPEGRLWAAANLNGINADSSSGITIDGVTIFAAGDGISGDTSTNLHVRNTDIINSARDGIWASGSKGLSVDKTTVTNSRRNGIDGWFSVTGAAITNSVVAASGTVGMPTESEAGIMFGDGSGNHIDTTRVTDSAYHGISVLHNRNTVVSNSLVYRACLLLNDCGGIYTGARDKLPLALRIEGNTVSHVGGTEGIAIYLDDFANGVTVTKNTISASTRGMLVHNGFDTVITYNTFSSSQTAHLAFGQDLGNIHNNQVTNNTFHSTNGEDTFNLEAGSNLKTFATFNNNTYTSTNTNVFGRIWDGSSPGVTLSYSSWKSYIGQEAQSTMNGAP